MVSIIIRIYNNYFANGSSAKYSDQWHSVCMHACMYVHAHLKNHVQLSHITVPVA